MPKYIDIHAHVNFKVFEDTRDEVIGRALENDTWVINIGTQLDTSQKAVEMTNDYKEGVYSTIGLHPIHTSASYHDEQELGPAFAKATDGQGKVQEFTSRGEIFDKEKYKELIKLGKVVAIGECGLDYYHLDEDSIEKQKVAFISQIELANELNLPLMVHIRNNYENKNRDAYSDALEILKNYSEAKGVVHFFEGSIEIARQFIELGFYISFAGPITYPLRKNGKGCDYQGVISQLPLEQIMADTDSPYVAPVPHRGRQNEPIYVAEIVKKIAEIKGLSEKEVAEAIVSNAKNLFNLPR